MLNEYDLEESRNSLRRKILRLEETPVLSFPRPPSSYAGLSIPNQLYPNAGLSIKKEILIDDNAKGI